MRKSGNAFILSQIHQYIEASTGGALSLAADAPSEAATISALHQDLK